MIKRFSAALTAARIMYTTSKKERDVPPTTSVSCGSSKLWFKVEGMPSNDDQKTTTKRHCLKRKFLKIIRSSL